MAKSICNACEYLGAEIIKNKVHAVCIFKSEIINNPLNECDNYIKDGEIAIRRSQIANNSCEICGKKVTGLELINLFEFPERVETVRMMCQDCIHDKEMDMKINKIRNEIIEDIMKPKITSQNILESILEQYSDEEILKADGFDEAIIGVEEHQMVLIYSVSKCLDILQRDMSHEDAIEYFEFNVCNAYVGEKTPLWCWDMF